MKITRKHLGLTIICTLLLGALVIVTWELIRPRTPEEIEKSALQKNSEFARLTFTMEYDEYQDFIFGGYFTIEEAKFICSQLTFTPAQQKENRLQVSNRYPHYEYLLQYIATEDLRWVIRYYYNKYLGIPMCKKEGSTKEVNLSWIPQYDFIKITPKGPIYYNYGTIIDVTYLNKYQYAQYEKWEILKHKISKPTHLFDNIDPAEMKW